MQAKKENIPSVVSFLPHRWPFLLIDSIELLEVPKIICKKLVSHSEPVFQGHFPGFPVFPGVMTVEASAQASGILLHYIETPEFMKNKLGVFAGIDKVRFKKMVVPGDQLTIHSQFQNKKMGVYFFQVQVEIGSELVMSGNIQVVLTPVSLDGETS